MKMIIKAVSLALLIFTFTSSAAEPSSKMEKVQDCFRGSFATHASWKALLKKGKKQFNEVGFDKRFPPDEFNRIKDQLECRDFVYKVGELNVEGYYLKPKQHKGKLPVIIYNRGGNASFGYVLFGKKLIAHAKLAEQGFIVVGSQYRGASPWIENNGEDEFGGADVQDVVALMDIIEQMPDADINRIGMMGWSRGAMQTYLAAKEMKGIKAMAAVAGSSDEELGLKIRPAMEKVFAARVPGFQENREAELKKRSVIHWAQDLPEVPLLLLHGDQDKRVNVIQSKKLAEKLKELNRPYELVIYPQDNHGLHKNQKAMFAKLGDWFHTHL